MTNKERHRDNNRRTYRLRNNIPVDAPLQRRGRKTRNPGKRRTVTMAARHWEIFDRFRRGRPSGRYLARLMDRLNAANPPQS